MSKNNCVVRLCPTGGLSHFSQFIPSFRLDVNGLVGKGEVQQHSEPLFKGSSPNQLLKNPKKHPSNEKNTKHEKKNLQ
jgi:hypothetical protein